MAGPNNKELIHIRLKEPQKVEAFINAVHSLHILENLNIGSLENILKTKGNADADVVLVFSGLSGNTLEELIRSIEELENVAGAYHLSAEITPQRRATDKNKLVEDESEFFLNAKIVFECKEDTEDAIASRLVEVNDALEANPIHYHGITGIRLHKLEGQKMALEFSGRFQGYYAAHVWNTEFASLPGVHRPSFRGEGFASEPE